MTAPSLPSSAPVVLRATGVSVSFDGRPVLQDVSLTVHPGHRLGVVGENGVGKSTLLRVLAGDLAPDRGEVQRPIDLGVLAQELVFTVGTAVADVLDAALAPARALIAEVEAAATTLGTDAGPRATTRYDDALLAADLAGAWEAEARLGPVLAGLGVAGLDPARRLLALSGGQRSRLALAALLVRRPAALLLDEPTNHLDDEAAEFLVEQVRALPGAVVLASHDRVFLDEVCTAILDLDPAVGTPAVTGGTFSDHLAAKELARRQWEEQHAREQAELTALRQSVATTSRQVAPGRGPRDRNLMAYGRHANRVEAQVSRRVRNARQRLDELADTQVRRPPGRLTFRPPVQRAAAPGDVVLWMSGVEVPGRVRVDRLEIGADATLLISGPNGSGKSTVLHLLAGDLAPTVGTVGRRRGVEVALLEQDLHLAGLERTPRELYDQATAGLPDVVRLTELGLVAPRDLDRPIGLLSVGQRRRVVLAMLVARSPEVLLLDEPTNHVSLALAGELQDALHASAGAVVVASHDRWLRRRWVGEEVVVRDGVLQR